MIDTVKIYSEIDINIYTKIYNNSIIKSSHDNKNKTLLYEIVNDHLEGSYSSNLSVRIGSGVKYGFANKGYFIEIEGSLHKILKGYNSHNGYYNLQVICNNLIQIVENYYNIKLPTLENWFLQRADIAICFDLSNQHNVCTYINNLSNCRYPRRGFKFYKDESIYVSGTTTTLKIYNKLIEFKTHDLKKFKDTDFNIFDYLNQIKGFIRFECEIKKKMLKKIYNENNISVLKLNYEDLKKVWCDEFMKLLKFVSNDLEIINNRNDVYDKLKEVYSPLKARNLYNFYLNVIFDGVQNTKNKLSKSVFYRNIGNLRKLNIDLSQKIDIDTVDNRLDFNPFEWKEVV